MLPSRILHLLSGLTEAYRAFTEECEKVRYDAGTQDVWQMLEKAQKHVQWAQESTLAALRCAESVESQRKPQEPLTQEVVKQLEENLRRCQFLLGLVKDANT